MYYYAIILLKFEDYLTIFFPFFSKQPLMFSVTAPVIYTNTAFLNP